MVHEDHAVADLARETEFVRHDSHGHAALGEIAHDRQNLADQFRIEGRGGLVEQHHLRLHRERAGNGDTLLLPPRHFHRIGIALVGKADALQQSHGLVDRLGPGALEHRDRAFDDVLQRGHVLEQVEALEDHRAGETLAGDFGIGELIERIARAAVADKLPVHPERTTVDPLELVDAAKERALAGTGRPDDAHDLALADLQRHVLESLEGAEILVDAPGNDHRSRHVQPPCPGASTRAVFFFFVVSPPRPLEKCFSRKYWPVCRTVTTARYQAAATISSSMTRAFA